MGCYLSFDFDISSLFMKDLKLTSSNRAFINQELDKVDTSSDVRLSFTPWNKKRSIPANRAYQGWYPAMADELALTIPECTRYIKLTFGLPILFSDDYMGSIIWEGLNSKGFFQLDYKDQLICMDKTYVTRLFDTKMHNRLRDDLQNYFGALGLDLNYGN